VDDQTQFWLLGAGLLVVILLVIATFLRVGQVENRLLRLMRHQGVDPNERLPLSDRVKEIARDPARKIEAIKLHREETGASLYDAKQDVEDYIRNLDR
jgi:hypothetical protein